VPRSAFYRNHWGNIDPERLDRYQRMFQWNPASSALYGPADIRPGHIVAEFSCGPGYTAVDIAKWVGPDGYVHALDVSMPGLSRKLRRMRTPPASTGPSLS
jgi:ubiquinone/menaquinone biosynthesis C-methylase UbiE